MNTGWISAIWMPTFVNLCLQATLILGLAVVALVVFRTRSAALRHHIAATALAGLLFLPLLNRAPAVTFTVPVSGRAPASAAKSNAWSSASPNSTVPARSITKTAASTSQPRTGPESLSTVTAISDPARQSNQVSAPLAVVQPPRVFSLPQSLGVALFVIWAIGVALLVVRFIASTLCLALLERRCPAVTSTTLCAEARLLARGAGIHRRILVLQDTTRTAISVPVTWGLWHPVILMPRLAVNWPQERIHAVLLHELAHIRRGDWAAQRLARLACAVFWFHPLAWNLERRMRLDAESACDDAVILSGVGATEYASHLLELVRTIRPQSAPAAAVSMARDSQVSARLQAILDARPRTAATRPALVAATIIAAATIMPIIFLRPLVAQITRAASQRHLDPAGLQTVWVQSALVPATGPGVVITLKDSTRRSPAGHPGSTVIHDRDISEIVNALKAAGAEALAISDQRVGVGTSVRVHGAEIEVNGATLHPPFVIRAIGDSDVLFDALKGAGGSVERLQQVDPAMVTIARSPIVDMTGFVPRDIRYRWARSAPAQQSASGPLDAALYDLRGYAGLTDVAGPGVVITLAGSIRARLPGESAGRRQIHAEDVAAIVSDLRHSGGAEAISIGDQRIVTTTGLKASGTGLLVNGVRVSRPFVVRAVGDPERLAGALALPQGVPALLRREDAAMIHVERSADLRLAAYAGANPRYVRPIQVPMRRAPAPQGGPSGQTITLPDGTGVELIAVGSSVYSVGEDWWRADGTPLAEPPIQTNNRFHRSAGGPGAQYLTRSLFFKLHSAVDGEASTTGYIVDPNYRLNSAGLHYGRDLRLNDTHLRPSEAATGMVVLGFPPADTRCTYRFGIASGPWETIAVTRMALAPAPRFIAELSGPQQYNPTLIMTENPTIAYQDMQGKDRSVSLLGGHAPLGDVARRLIAFDRDGAEVPLPDSEYEPLSRSTMARIAEFRLQTRPYQWAEFKDIELQPKRGASHAPIATPAALPQFKHRFSNGLNVSLLSLTERNSDGGRWWRPDGKPLAGPVKECISQISFEGYTRHNHPRAVVFKFSCSQAVDFSQAVQVIPDLENWPTIQHISNDAGLVANSSAVTGHITNYPSSTHQFTYRFGVAAGVWKTIGVVAMPRDVRHKSTGPNSFAGDTMCRLSDHPTLTFESSSGQSQSVAFLPAGRNLGNGARRVIAIDRSGKIIPLQVTSSGSPQVGRLIALTFADSGILHRHNALDLATIKEFRLQTRPYEWAEFKGIQLEPGK